RRRPARTPRRSAAAPERAPIDPTPPVNEGGAQTTGRFLVVYKDSMVGAPKDAERSLRDTTGIKHMVSAADFRDHAIEPQQASDADAAYFPALGIAVVA